MTGGGGGGGDDELPSVDHVPSYRGGRDKWVFSLFFCSTFSVTFSEHGLVDDIIFTFQQILF